MASRFNKGSMTHSRRVHAYPEGELPEGPGFDGYQQDTPTVADDATVEGETFRPTVLQLMRYANSPNIAEMMDEDELNTLGSKVCQEYDIDLGSRDEWTAGNEQAMKLAKQTVEKKNTPWPNASNVKYPLLSKAAVEFNSRSYPALVTKDLVKCQVNGYDPDGQKAARAERVAKTMSWQCLEDMDGWDDDTDQMLMVLPIIGMAFKKTYFDKSIKQNVSELVMPGDLVFNYGAKNFKRCPRKTHRLELYPYQIRERVLNGIYLEWEYGLSDKEGNDIDAPHLFLEQHRLEDLDGDGYPEPYAVTVHYQTQRVCRIVARYTPDDITEAGGQVLKIEPTEYFTKYGFFPNPDGSAHDIGFGSLVGPINHAINTTLNQTLDAGKLANTQGGFIGKGMRMKGGSFRLKPGEYKPVDTSGAKIKENIVPLNFPGPSPVLFQLLGLLIDAGENLAQIRDVLEGKASGANQSPTTTLALIEQGMKVFSGIYKRLHRSQKQEFKLLYKLNSLYMEPKVYITFLDANAPTAVLLNDFRDEDLAITPGSDPAVTTDMQQIARAEALLPLRGSGNWDDAKIEQRYMEAMHIPDIEDLRADPRQKQEMMLMQQMQLREEMMIKRTEAEAKMLKARSGAIKDIADAEAQEIGQQLEYYQAATDRLTQMIQGTMSGGNSGQPQQNGTAGLASPRGPAGMAPA
jgi:chaperonin GroES